MRIAVTGATGFVGHYIVNQLTASGHVCRCWHRPTSDRGGFEDYSSIEWVEGDLSNRDSFASFVENCDAIVHSAFWRPGKRFQGGEGDAVQFAETNVIGTLALIEASRAANLSRFVYISSCAVHDQILDDRPLDEDHPLRAKSHYGAHKAAIEKFVHSFGLGHGFPICSLRPTGVYGVRRPIEDSKWFQIVRDIAAGKTVECNKGGKEIHAADVARATELLLNANKESIIGQSFNCYDRYISQWDVAQLTKQISGSNAEIVAEQTTPKNQIVTEKIRALGMQFGGEHLLEQTIKQLVAKPDKQ